ncbi:RNA-directed DNA polymerase, eukaryota [Tanacetum coccineum]
MEALSQRTTSIPITGGSILEGCSKNIAEIIGTQGDSNALWGNLAFDHAMSPSVGNSGGILCVWDSSMFIKKHVYSSDYFLVVMGIWDPSSSKLLIISVYSHQELIEKRELWGYLHSLINRWDGEVVILGDFNEVRSEQERFSSLFNSQGASAFNNFIATSGLIDLPLGGYSYTWAHKSASKMSKLDRFLISKGLMVLFPHLSGLCLDRKLSDHRPIIMCELNLDYGPTPFRIFHSWFNLEGFDSFVEDLWHSLNITDSNALTRLKKKFYLFSDPSFSRVKIDFQFPNRLNLDQVEELECSTLYDEIKKAVWDYGTNKSPGPDGFAFEFYRKYWNIFDQEIVAVVSEFFASGKFPPGCNSTFITLIPKIHDAKVIKDFRPISLIGSIYKIVVKIMANRLCSVMPILISDVQTAFVSNRQILDGPFILNELLAWCKLKKVNAMIFKVDFEKAFDSVQWDYLDAPPKERAYTPPLFRLIKAIHGVRGVTGNHSSLKRASPQTDLVRDFISLNRKEVSLKFLFPRLFALESRKDITMAEMLRRSSYDYSFRRSPRGGLEEEQYNGSCSMIFDISLPNMCDHWFWSLDGSSEFSVRSVRCLIDDALLPKSDTPTRWVKLIPIKVNVLAWKICFDRMPIRLNLFSLGLEIPLILCPLCNDVVESSSHLFFSCSLARQVLRLICRWWELEVPSLNSYIDWLSCLSNTRLSKLMKEILEGTCYISWWIIWRYRLDQLGISHYARGKVKCDWEKLFTLLVKFLRMETEGLISKPQSSVTHRMFPAVLPVLFIAITYVDPGKWVAAVEGGAHFGYDLILLMFLFSLAAVLCQYLSASIAVVTGKDLAQICSSEYGTVTCIFLGIQAESSMIALDLSMILGIAHGLNLMFGMGLFTCVFLASFDAFLFPIFSNLLETDKAKFVCVRLASVVLLSYLFGVLMNQPDTSLSMGGNMLTKFSSESVFALISLLGASIMPHNFYLHSSLVQQNQRPEQVTKEALCLDHLFAICGVFSGIFVVNYVLMNSAANVFFSTGLDLLTFQDALSLMDQV